MKRILQSTLILALALAAGTTAVAQNTYHPITDGCTWSVSNEKYMTAGDTVLDGKTYLKLYRQVENQPFEFSLENAEYFAAIRDDSAERKVYAYLPAGTQIWNHNQGHHVTDTGLEVVLYDFSTRLDDYFSYYTICPGSNAAHEIYANRVESVCVLTGYGNGHIYDTCYVDSDSLVTISDGTTRKRILLQTDGNIYEEVWIEGIGRLRSFEDASIVDAECPFKILLCYSDSTGSSYQTGFDFDGLDDCFNYGNGGGDVPSWEKLNIRVYPNPVTDLLIISTLWPCDDLSSVQILDIAGSCVYQRLFTDSISETAIDMKQLPKGLYILQIQQSNKRKCCKIIKL